MKSKIVSGDPATGSMFQADPKKGESPALLQKRLMHAEFALAVQRELTRVALRELRAARDRVVGAARIEFEAAIERTLQAARARAAELKVKEEVEEVEDAFW